MRGAVNVRASGPNVHDFPPFVIAAVRASLVRLLHFMAMGALRERRSSQVVVRPPLVLAGFRMTSFWIGHTVPPFAPNRMVHSMVFPLGFLLLFEPLLLQTRQGRHARVRDVDFTAAFLVVQIDSALRAKSPAIAAADNFHRQREEHLFGQDVG